VALRAWRVRAIASVPRRLLSPLVASLRIGGRTDFSTISGV
jgi:hypothetical protein